MLGTAWRLLRLRYDAALALGLRRSGLRQVPSPPSPQLVAGWEDVALEKSLETQEGDR